MTRDWPKRYNMALHYYCMWLGWRGQNLEIDTDHEYPMVCSKTRMGVVYTLSSDKYLQQGMSKADQRNYGLEFLAKVNGVTGGTQASSSMTSIMSLAWYPKVFSIFPPYFLNFQAALPLPPTTR